MGSVDKQCVTLTNLPPTIKEEKVREILDIAHKRFVFLDRYEKLHRHVESDSDVRWIVLFKTREDALRCIKLGSWKTDIVQGECWVKPDYCSGCIVPEEWEEDFDSMYMNSDDEVPSAKHSSSDSNNSLTKSFVMVDSSEDEIHSDGGNGDQDQFVCAYSQKIKPVPALPLKNHANLNDTLPVCFENDFDTCESGTSDDLFASGNTESKGEMISKVNAEKAENTDCSTTVVSGENLSSSELFGSGFGNNVDKKDEASISSSELFGSETTRESSFKSPQSSLRVSTETKLAREKVPSAKANDELVNEKDTGARAKTYSSGRRYDSPKEDNTAKCNEGIKELHKILSSDQPADPEGKVENTNTVRRDEELVDNLLTSKTYVPKSEVIEKEITDSQFDLSGSRNGKNTWNTSVRSVDLFGHGNENYESLEFSYNKEKDKIETGPDQSDVAATKVTDKSGKGAGCGEDTRQEPDLPKPESNMNMNTAHNELYQVPMANQLFYQQQQLLQQQYATYMQTMMSAQNPFMAACPEGNLSSNIMGFQSNPMPFPGFMPTVFPQVPGQPVGQQGAAGMPSQVVFVPMYMPHGMPLTSRHHDDNMSRNETGSATEPRMDGSVLQDQCSDKELGLKEPQDYENTFIENNTDMMQTSNDINTRGPVRHIMENPNARTNDHEDGKGSTLSKGNQKQMNVVPDNSSVLDEDMYLTPTPYDQNEDENPYAYVDESRMKSLRSLKKSNFRQESNSEATRTLEQHPPPLPHSHPRKERDVPKTMKPSESINTTEYDQIDHGEAEEDELEFNEEKSRMILIEGISEDTTHDGLELYFENKKRSGGGEVESVDFHTKKGKAIIEFKNRRDVLDVMQKVSNGQKHILLGKELTVSEYIPPPFDPLKVFVRDIAPTTTNDCVTNFISKAAGSEPVSIDLGETPGTAMIIFNTAPDVTAIKELCARRKCEGKHWTVSPVEVTHSVKVMGATSHTHDSLSLYFENTKKSGGGDVENLDCREYDCIVTFENAEDAERVCRRKHILGGKELHVSLFYPCLELDEDYTVPIPSPILVEDLEEYIVRFLLKSDHFKAEIENRVRSAFGEVIWSSDEGETQSSIQIVCTVDPKDKHGQAKVKNWKENCLSAFQEATGSLSAIPSRNVAVEVWDELKNRLSEIVVSNPDNIAVILENKECKVVMVGEMSMVKNMSAQLETIIRDIEGTLKTERETITKKKRLRVYELALLRASRIESTLKRTLDAFEIDNESRELTFRGKQTDVDEAMKKVEDKLKSFAYKTVEGMRKEARDLLFRKEARDYIKKKMNEKKIIGVWDVRNFGLVMYSKNEKDLNLAIEIFKTSVVTDAIPLDSEKNEILVSDVGKTKISEFEERYKECLIFTIRPSELGFVCTDTIHQEIKDEFTKLFDIHSVISTFLRTDPGVFSFISVYKRKEIDDIERQYRRLSVVVEPKDSPTKPGFLVRGKKDGCKLAVNKLQALTASVIKKDHTLPWPGFDKFLLSTDGKDCIKIIEFSEKCVIKASSETLSSGVGGTEHETGKDKSQIRYRHQSLDAGLANSKITKEVKLGSLAAERVDVIVNSTNRLLDLNIGAISRTLLNAAGPQLQTECKQLYPDELKPGQVAVTTGGSLNCKKLFHGLLTKWDGGQGNAQRVLDHFVTSCLLQMDRCGFSSIAFPALGTGALGFPADVVASMMFDIVDAFEKSYPNTCVKMVRFVVWSEDRVAAKAFQDAESGRVRRRHSAHASPSSRHSYRHSTTEENLYVKGDGFNTTIGQVSVSITQGDLTKSICGAIVNSTMDDLNLNSGAVSKAILTAAGDTIQTEAFRHKQRFATHGFVITSPGKLMCQNIIHVRARNSSAGWTETIRACLIVAESLGLTSIAFPALGTGGKGVSGDKMSRLMMETFQDFINSADFKKCLKSINIVIFDRHLMDAFVSEAKSTLDPSKRSKPRYSKYLPDLSDFKFWANKPTKEQDTGGVTLHICAESSFSLRRILASINDIRKEKDVFVPLRVCENMDETSKNDLRRIGYTFGVKFVFEVRRIKVMGYGKQPDKATKKAQEYIDTLDKDFKRNQRGSGVPLPQTWTQMKITDPIKVVMLHPSDKDYINVSVKFANESGIPITNIVKIERIQNPTLYTQYIGKKRQMELDHTGRQPVEQRLWHGTKGNAVDNINQKGFDRNYNSGASHGVGVYFAKLASTSAQGYCSPDSNGYKHIYLADVLTGDYCVGQGGIRVPPAKPGLGLKTYDSTTDNVRAPNFFVIFHDAQAYPSFLITFR